MQGKRGGWKGPKKSKRNRVGHDEYKERCKQGNIAKGKQVRNHELGTWQRLYAERSTEE
jgi:hypothetical protein